MAYNFIKLSEVELVESPQSVPNVLIEDNGEIKRMSAESLGGGGGGSNTIDYEIINFTEDSGICMILKNGARDEIVEEWNKGASIRLKASNYNGGLLCLVASGLSFIDGKLLLITADFFDPVSNTVYKIMEEDEV